MQELEHQEQNDGEEHTLYDSSSDHGRSMSSEDKSLELKMPSSGNCKFKGKDHKLQPRHHISHSAHPRLRPHTVRHKLTNDYSAGNGSKDIPYVLLKYAVWT